MYEGGYPLTTISKSFFVTKAAVLYWVRKENWKKPHKIYSAIPENCVHKYFVVRCSHCGSVLGSEEHYAHT